MLENQEYFEGEFIPLDYEHPLNSEPKSKKRTKKEKEELDSFISKKELQDNILGLASAFLNVPEFYFPVNLDFRGRLNCVSEYLNYQSSDLARSLLVFSRGEDIDKTDEVSINYLKVYGASCFGLSRMSMNDRIN